MRNGKQIRKPGIPVAPKKVKVGSSVNKTYFRS